MRRYVFAALPLFFLLMAMPTVGTENVQKTGGEAQNKGTQAMVDKGQIEIFFKSAQNELEQNILGFWIKYCQDNEYGGFIGRMANDRTIEKNGPKGLVQNARILWTFSAAYRYKKNDEYIQMAKRAYDYLMQNFWDKQYGGAYWMLDNTGKAKDDSKEVYGQSFLIYALVEYYLATGDNAALEKAKEIFNLIEKHCHDDVNKGYFETFARDWSVSEKAMLASGDVKEKKTMNTHLHLLEAYTNLYRVWKDEKLKSRLIELIEIFQKHIINSKTYHFELFFDEKWTSTKNIESLGHDIEGSWLLCEAAEVLCDEHIIKEIQATAMKMVKSVCEIGFDTDGGLFYESEGGRIINPKKDWWPQAEAVVGLINAYQLSGQEHHLESAQRSWAYIQEHIVDSEYGEWFWDSERGNLKVSEWKGPYHNSRVCLEVIRRLQDIKK